MAEPKKQAPKAKERYAGGVQVKIKNTNPYINNSFGYMIYPRLTDYDAVVADDGNLLYEPSFIAKGFDYSRGDSVAIEVPRHIKNYRISLAQPVYRHKDTEEFKRLSRRTDEAKSVSSPSKKQQGGQLNMNEQELQQAFIQFLAQKTGAKTQQELEAAIQQLGEEGLKQAYAEFMQLIQQQQVQAAKFGAKINYIKKLRGQCPDGYELQYYKSGGQLCKKCMKKQVMQDGGDLPQDPIDQFKCGRKMKKKKCEAGGIVDMDKCGAKMKKKKCENGGFIPFDKCGKKMKKKQEGGGLETSNPNRTPYKRK